jgi:hypothetical protein
MTFPGRFSLIAALGVTQIMGYGTLYYAFPILVPAIARDFLVSEPVVFGIFSAGLLLGGLVAPLLGRVIDRMGAARVMTGGSLVVAALVALWAHSPNIYVFGALALLIETVSFTILYDAAFALLAQKRPDDTRRSITRLTLIAGFASTIFWPLTGFLADAFGWRGTLLGFAACHLVCAALHSWMARLPVLGVSDGTTTATGARAVQFQPIEDQAVARRAFRILALAFALSGMALSAVTVHLVEILRSFTAGDTVFLAAMVMGPAQVAVRVVDATVWRNLHPLVVAMVSAASIAVAILVLLAPGPPPLLAFSFAAILGAGAGLASIVRGAVPVALFGVLGLGQRLGWLAGVRNVLGAAAPFLFAWAASAWSMAWAVGAALALACGGLVLLVILHHRMRVSGVLRPR